MKDNRQVRAITISRKLEHRSQGVRLTAYSENINLFRGNDIWRRDFVNVVSLKYIGMIYTNVGEMCFIPLTVQWRSSAHMAGPFACSFNNFLHLSAFILLFFYKTLHPPSPFLCFYPPVYMYLFSFFDTHPVFRMSGLSLRLGDVDFSSCNPKLFANY